MPRTKLGEIIESFEIEEFSQFFRLKAQAEGNFRPSEERFSQYDDADFLNFVKIGQVEFSGSQRLLVAGAKVLKDLSERSGKKAQYEKAKKMLRELSAYSAGIFIYYDKSGNFRFSLIYPESVGTRREWSNFRRFTYFVSKELTNKTFLQRIGDGDFSTLEKIKDAFSVEKVTKEFYLEYRKLFDSLMENLSKNHTFLNEASKNRINTENFAKKLLGQIVFLYFVQKKGWIGVPSGKGWGEGDKNFMGNIYKEAMSKKANFYNDYLEKLFYNALNNPHRDSADPSFSKDFGSRIPFLNGGLFEAEYDWKNSLMYLDNKIFHSIFDVFERYNFTIEEESPDDKEIAVDPEMLGKVFENLLPENLRKGKGTYYTPREIVYYMCRESLVNYLVSNHSNITEENIRNYIFYSESFENFKKQKGESFTPGQWKELDDLLVNIRVCDPACGSGAFLVGMLNMIVKLRIFLQTTPDHHLIQQKKEYELKRETIQNCIYGVDIDPGAIEIAKLRLWLALVVDYDLEDIEPLPNLDYRLMCGNSLLEEFEGVKFYNGENETQATLLPIDPEKQKKVDLLKNKVKEYFSVHDDKDKLKKRKEINDIKDWLIGTALERRHKDLTARHKSEEAKANMLDEKSRKKYLDGFSKWLGSSSNIQQALESLHNPKKEKPFFIWKLEFIDVFEEKGGFDVMIANPPYVRADSPDFKAQREAIMQSQLYETLYEKWDLFLPFIERGLKLLSDSGNLSYITSNSLLTSKFAFRLLEFIQKNYAVKYIDYFSDDTKVFDAGVVPVVFGIARKAVNPNVRKTLHHGVFNHIIRQEIIPIVDFKVLGKEAFKLSANSFKSTAKTIPLGDICYLSYGLRPNSDERFWKGEFARDDLVSDVKDKEHPVQYIEGKNLDYYRINNVLYLEWGTDRVPKKLVRQTFPELYKRPKLLRGTMTGGTYDDTSIVCNHSIVVFVRFIDLSGVENKSISGSLKRFNSLPRIDLEKISTKFNLKYLLAILNSKFANNFLNGIRRHRLENYFYPDDFRKLPIADIPAKDQKLFIEFVDKILAITKDNDYLENSAKQAKVHDYEKQIDQLVYKLYALTPEEIKIVENHG